MTTEPQALSPLQLAIRRRLKEALSAIEEANKDNTDRITRAAIVWLTNIDNCTPYDLGDCFLSAAWWSSGLDEEFCRNNKSAICREMNKLLTAHDDNLCAYEFGTCIHVSRTFDKPQAKRETTMAEILGRAIADEVLYKAQANRDAEMRSKGYTQSEIYQAFYAPAKTAKVEEAPKECEPVKKPTRNWFDLVKAWWISPGVFGRARKTGR